MISHWRLEQWTSFQSATSGDINGDGINDLLIGSPDFYLNNAQTIQEQRGAGAALTIYGKNGGLVNGYMNEQLEISYSNYDSSKGFKVYGAHAFDTLGSSLSSILAISTETALMTWLLQRALQVEPI
jgi:hypothetical protein